MLAIAAPIIDTSALWRIVLASLAGGAGGAIAFGAMLIGISRGRLATHGGTRVLSYGVALLAGLFVVAAVVLGLHAMTSKS